MSLTVKLSPGGPARRWILSAPAAFAAWQSLAKPPESNVRGALLCSVENPESRGPRRRAPAPGPPPTGPLSWPHTCSVFWKNSRNILPARCAEQRGEFPQVTLKWAQSRPLEHRPQQNRSPMPEALCGDFFFFSFKRQRLLLRLASPSEHGCFGLRSSNCCEPVV